MTSQAKKLLIWAEKSAGARHMGAIPTHAAPYMVVHINDLDSDLFLLNVQNGTIVIRRLDDGNVSVTLKPHDPNDLITRLSPVNFDPTATCPTYDAALAHVQPDADVRAFLHRAVGYAATGDTSEQKLFFFYGGGRNGKSTFVDAWAHVLGTYAATIPIETFLSGAQSRYAGQASPHLARLRAIRMLRTSEAEKDAVLAESFIKLATSNEPILVRELNQPFFELRPQFKLFISGNYKPRIRGTDDGIWRRIILVPWLVKVSDEMCDPHLADKLKAEASGILNRMLEGVVDWMKGGLQVPPPIAEATAEYRSDSDHLGRFKAECLREVPGSRVTSADIYDVFVAWAKSTGAPIWTRTGFGRAMTDRGYKSTKSGSNFWIGIELTRQLSDFGSADEPPVDDPAPPTATDDTPMDY